MINKIAFKKNKIQCLIFIDDMSVQLGHVHYIAQCIALSLGHMKHSGDMWSIACGAVA